MSRVTQKSQILNALIRGEWLTRMDCIKQFGCIEAGARITELRQDNWPIDTVMTSNNGKRFAIWKMNLDELKDR